MVSAMFLASLLAVSGSGATDVTLLHFTADWCRACQSVKPTTQRLVTAGYPVREINVDREANLVQQFRVTSVPCFVLVSGGREVERVAEATTYARLVQMFDRAGVNSGQVATSAPPQSSLVRGQSEEPSTGIALPRPLASFARSFGRNREPASQGEVDPRVPVQAPIQAPIEATTGVTSAVPASRFMPPIPSPSQPATPSVLPSDSLSGLAPSAPADRQSLALQATVRLRIDDLQGHSVGTGTIIDTHQQEALIVTCGHLFRDSVGKGRIAVDLFTEQQSRTVNGTLIRYDLERDLAFVAIPLTAALPAIRVAPAGFHLERGQAVFSVGCDRGADPTVRASRITGIDRYVGAPNIEVAGQPVEGRSGGGLFSTDGLLIGVCNAADPKDNEGVFASLPAIHWELDRIGQRRIYASSDPQVAQPAPRQAAPQPALVALTSAPAAISSTPPSPGLAMGGSASGTGHDDTEVICIVRSRANPHGTQQLLILDRPSRDLLDRLSHESHTRPIDGMAQQQPATPPAARSVLPTQINDPIAPLDSRQVIRAQMEN